MGPRGSGPPAPGLPLPVEAANAHRVGLEEEAF